MNDLKAAEWQRLEIKREALGQARHGPDLRGQRASAALICVKTLLCPMPHRRMVPAQRIACAGSKIQMRLPCGTSDRASPIDIYTN
jgi:hypothetical protein